MFAPSWLPIIPLAKMWSIFKPSVCVCTGDKPFPTDTWKNGWYCGGGLVKLSPFFSITSDRFFMKVQGTLNPFWQNDYYEIIHSFFFHCGRKTVCGGEEAEYNLMKQIEFGAVRVWIFHA